MESENYYLLKHFVLVNACIMEIQKLLDAGLIQRIPSIQDTIDILVLSHKVKMKACMNAIIKLSLFYNDKFEYDECCVCYRKTLTKTCCEHSMCYKCYLKLEYKEIKSEDCLEGFEDIQPDDTHALHCPYCRNIMQLY